MKNKIHLNKEVSIDGPKLNQSRMVILANSGAGKSYAIRKFAEEAVASTQTIIIDPEGEFSSLREKFDFILAGKDKDVPAEPRSAALLAVRLLELGKSAVIDLYELHPQERQRFVKLFFDAMINAPKDLYHPVFIILDEAHEYAPEGKPSEATYAVEAMASRGRKRGFCLIPASQRISKLSKNVSAECNNKLIGRASQDIDMKRAGDELGFTKERMIELRQLKPGEFFAFGPAISDEVIKIKIGEVKTTHAKVGYHSSTKVPPPSAVIKKILAEIKDLPAEAEKELKTVQELKQQNTQLKHDLKLEQERKVNLGKTIVDLDATDKLIKQAVDKAVYDVEKRMQDEFWLERDQWLAQIQTWFRILKEIGETMNEYTKKKPKLKMIFSSKALEPAESVTMSKKGLSFSRIKMPENIVPGNPILNDDWNLGNFSRKVGMTVVRSTNFVDMDGKEVSAMNKGEREIMIAVAQHEGITKEHIGVLTGYKSTSRHEYLRKLVSRGYIIFGDDKKYWPVKEGIDVLGDFAPLPVGDALRHHYMRTLPPGELKVFTAIAECYPEVVGRPMLENLTGYKSTSLHEYARKLIARKIIEKIGGGYKVNDALYD